MTTVRVFVLLLCFFLPSVLGFCLQCVADKFSWKLQSNVAKVCYLDGSDTLCRNGCFLAKYNQSCHITGERSRSEHETKLLIKDLATELYMMEEMMILGEVAFVVRKIIIEPILLELHGKTTIKDIYKHVLPGRPVLSFERNKEIANLLDQIDLDPKMCGMSSRDIYRMSAVRNKKAHFVKNTAAQVKRMYEEKVLPFPFTDKNRRFVVKSQAAVEVEMEREGFSMPKMT
jgi:hypothetical protein